MALLCWQEFGELVPARIRTVLVPFGSLEPHGVIPNGTDSLAPEAMARDIAGRLDALIAPVLNYGMTESMKAYPGAVSIGAETYAPFAEAVLDNLAANGFRNLIVLNGHGGNTAALNAAATRVANARRVRILVVNWWTLADDITKSVFKQNGGHAGNNETAYIQAFLPAYVHPERYKPEMASPIPPPGAYYAAPSPSTILLYEKGQATRRSTPRRPRSISARSTTASPRSSSTRSPGGTRPAWTSSPAGQAARSRKTRRSMTLVPVGPVMIRFPVCLKKA